MTSPTTSITSRRISPWLMDVPANPDAIPVAKGLIVEPKVPIPQPSRTTAAPVRASYPAAIMTAMTSE